MATGADVLEMLCSGKEWAIWENDYESINWYGKAPLITKAEFEAGFLQYDQWKSAKDAKDANDKAALLTKLGINAAELRLLLG